MRQAHNSGSPECGVVAVFPDSTARHSGYNAGIGWWSDHYGVGHAAATEKSNLIHGNQWQTVRINVAADGNTYFYLNGELEHTTTDDLGSSGSIRFGNNCRDFDYRSARIFS